MRPNGISSIVRLAILSFAVLMVLWGAGLRTDSGVALAQLRSGQSSGQPKLPPEMQDPSAENPNVPPDPLHAKIDEDRRKAINDDRHKRLAADVDRLVALTGELKTDVDKTTKDELSLDVVKKAQEIEKLAHDVQSRMKN